MSWHREWQSIEKCIAEFTTICSEVVAARSASSSDSLGTCKDIILPMAKELADKIHALIERYQSQIPEAASKMVNDIINESDFLRGFEKASDTLTSVSSVAHFNAHFRKFRADFNYMTSDLEGAVLRITARAFTHLQRSIVADADFRTKWERAYEAGEIACEKLGAAHLLLHGIWSFKANSEGERTDLILGEPLMDKNLNDVYLTAEGLVLTEWKLARRSNYKSKCKEAHKQAAQYGKGSMASIELKRYRYLVIVSDDWLSLPSNFEEKGINYEYINISI